MAEWGPATYGDRNVERYDEWVAGLRFDTDGTVTCLADLAAGGPVLELAIGTGRLALPLAARGLEVRGIDASEAMVAELRKKPGGDAIPVAIGDFADVAVDGQFGLVFVAFNTLFALLTQDDQARCFANVAARLRPGGRFVVEGFVPDLSRYERDQCLSVTRVGVDDVQLDASRHDPDTQRIDSAQVVITSAGVQLFPVRLRYAWPPELDLMARLAGLRLEARWGGWDRRPFGADSVSHVSVYARHDD